MTVGHGSPGDDVLCQHAAHPFQRIQAGHAAGRRHQALLCGRGAPRTEQWAQLGSLLLLL